LQEQVVTIEPYTPGSPHECRSLSGGPRCDVCFGLIPEPPTYLLRVGYREKANWKCAFVVNIILNTVSADDPVLLADIEGQVKAHLALGCSKCNTTHSSDEVEVFDKQIVRI